MTHAYTGDPFSSDIRDETTGKSLLQFNSLTEILLHRAETTPNTTAFIIVDNKGKELRTYSFKEFAQKVSLLAAFLVLKKNISTSDMVVLAYDPGFQLTLAIHACMYANIPFTIVSPPNSSNLEDTMSKFVHVIEESECKYILGDYTTENHLKNKMVSAKLKPLNKLHLQERFISTEKVQKIQELVYQANTAKEMKEPMCMLEYYVIPNGISLGLILDQRTLLERCKQQKEVNQLTTSKPLLSTASPYFGLGFIYSNLLGIFIGSASIVMNCQEDPLSWLRVASKYKGKVL